MKLLNPLPQRLDTGATATFAGLLAGDGTAAAPSISFAADTDTGFYRFSANALGVSLGGTNQFIFGTDGSVNNSRLFGGDTATGYVNIVSGGAAKGSISLVAGTGGGANQNITLTPSGTGYVVNSQASITKYLGAVSGVPSYGGLYIAVTPTGANYTVAGNGTDTLLNAPAGFGIIFQSNASALARLLSNGRFLLGTTTDSGALLQVGTNTTTGTGGMVFGSDTFLYRQNTSQLALDGTSATDVILQYRANGTYFGRMGVITSALSLECVAGFTIKTNGAVTALTLDASQNATFAASVTAASSVNAGTNAGFVFTSKCVITSPSDGILKLSNNAQTDFTRLQFGGVTSSFPALSRSGVRLVARLADDSSVAELEGALVSAGAAVTVGASRIAYSGTTATTVGAAGGASALPATPTGYIIVNVAGTQMKVPYYAN
jgi:hypothetical protein